MWLKQMVIDGFKSYAQRTVISDWDRHFTAITGLNGSGKSNILDAICFVLGITNLSQVRVENLQQLVYKEGQARVTKASVSLVFDNRDTCDSPIGYEDYDEITVTRQVIIGGRNKYMINGATAQLSRIRDLFHSVQLDVNNPHFLIMQGRITKVLNMRPHEILGMIQEAAGTKMYELKKAQALRTMAKKQVKVNEINEILECEITPQLQRLRTEKQHYLEWTTVNHELEKLSRLIVIRKFKALSVVVDDARVKDELQSLCAEMEFLQDDIEKVKNEMSVIEGEKDQRILQCLGDRVNEKNKRIKSLEQRMQNQTDTIQKEESELSQLQSVTQKKLESQLRDLKREFSECEINDSRVNQRYSYLRDRIESLESQQLGIGMDEQKKDCGSLAQQLMEAKRLKSQYKSELISIESKKKSLSKEICKQKSEIKRHRKTNEKLRKEYAAKNEKLSQLKAEMSEVSASENRQSIEVATLALEEKTEQLYGLAREISALSREESKFDFAYSAPFPEFSSQSVVYGKLGRLFRVRDGSHFCRAIEICAGGKLYNVVVDTNETAKHLLNHGKLAQRVTIIPLNKIQCRSVSAAVVHTAKRLVGAEHCDLALSLVDYDAPLESAMKFVFGNAFICSDMNSAKLVAFNTDIQCKSVTVDGEVFSPAGTLTGGSSPRSQVSVLQNMAVLREKRELRAQLQLEMESLSTQLRSATESDNQRSSLSRDIELLSHELSVISDRMKDSAYQNIENRIAQLQASLDECDMVEIEHKLRATEQKCIDLQRDMSNYENQKKDQIKHVKQEIVDAKKELSTLENNLSSTTENKNRICEEIASLAEECTHNTALIASMAESIAGNQAQCQTLSEEIAQLKSDKSEIESELCAKQKKLSEQDCELHKLAKIVSKNERQHSLMDINVSKLKAELASIAQQIAHSKKMVSKMLSSYAWLNNDINSLCPESSDSDESCMAELNKKQARLREEQSVLQKKINHKVMSMFERAENEYRDLIKKREIIRNDKKKIESVIRELDKKKEDTLETTYTKVNEHFGNIFSKLLPGTQCKLQKMKKARTKKTNESKDDSSEEEECSILDGLEVKVAFGNDLWKESLSELSGGQRSLLALSLILSLLLFKPAPLYILDEIDAALDLSHTQNIGILISKYFAKSQFIVVSLKEGMFTNANVIFRTSFIDGVSAVKRSVGSGASVKNQR